MLRPSHQSRLVVWRIDEHYGGVCRFRPAST